MLTGLSIFHTNSSHWVRNLAPLSIHMVARKFTSLSRVLDDETLRIGHLKFSSRGYSPSYFQLGRNFHLIFTRTSPL